MFASFLVSYIHMQILTVYVYIFPTSLYAYHMQKRKIDDITGNKTRKRSFQGYLLSLGLAIYIMYLGLAL